MSASNTCASTCQATPAFIYAAARPPAALPPTWCSHARVRYFDPAARDLPGMNELVGAGQQDRAGAALMTETKMEMRIISAVSNMMPNTPLEQIPASDMEELGPPHFDEVGHTIVTAKIPVTLTDKDLACRLSFDRHGPDGPAAGRFQPCRWTPSGNPFERLDRCRAT